MATAHNPKDIFFEHEMAVQEEDAERAAERESAHDIDWEALDKLTDAMSDMVLQNINEKFQKSIFGKFIKPHFFQNRIDQNPSSKKVFLFMAIVYPPILKWKILIFQYPIIHSVSWQKNLPTTMI